MCPHKLEKLPTVLNPCQYKCRQAPNFLPLDEFFITSFVYCLFHAYIVKLHIIYEYALALIVLCVRYHLITVTINRASIVLN